MTDIPETTTAVDEIKNFLDSRIQFHRHQKDIDGNETARYHIESFQEVRVWFYGEYLGREEKPAENFEITGCEKCPYRSKDGCRKYNCTLPDKRDEKPSFCTVTKFEEG